MQGQFTHPGSDSSPRTTVIRYASAILAVAAAVFVAASLQPLLDATVVFLIAVVIAAWFSGLWPALLASLLSTVALDFFFTAPFYQFTGGFHSLARMAAFTAVAALFASTSARRRSAERALKEARDQLDAKVRERTAELEAAHARVLAQADALREQADELEELAGRLIHAQEEERSRIGRELHDHISQMLGVLTIRIDQLRIDPATPAPLAGALEELRHSTAEITTDIHSLSHRLHSSALDYLGLVPALQRLIAEFSARHGIAIEFTHSSVPPALPGGVALCLFRVAEESLTNIAKHSRARTARVHVRGASDGLHLTVEDSGAGFDVDSLERRGGGLGFVSMRERLRLVRGTLRIDSAPSRGTRVEVTVPAASLTTAGPPGAPADESGRRASDVLSSA